MEFKGGRYLKNGRMVVVDIGTEWNLKYSFGTSGRKSLRVDIGTEWNLKAYRRCQGWKKSSVDIGTEWNLKD